MKKLLLVSMISAVFAVPAVAEETADIVVIGSGGAGLSSAITAHDLGKKVIVLEKMAYLGGNTNRSTGGLNAAGTKYQAKLGIKDDVQTMINDTMKGGGNINNPELVKTLAENAPGSVDFIIGLGGDLTDVGFMAAATNKRCHRPTGGAPVGPEIVKTLVNASKDRHLDIRTMAKADKILTENGKVVGVQYSQKGKPEQTIKAKAVVIATGGFSANQDMLVKLKPELKGFATTNHPGATGEGIALGESVGAATVDMDQIQTHPTVVPGKGVMLTEAVRGNGAIIVNREGKRFVNEMDTRAAVSKAILDQKGQTAFLLFDQDVRKSLKAIEGYVKGGLTTEGATLDELAKKLGMNAANLKATMATYAKDQANKKDTQFNRPNMERPLTQGPWYAVEITPAVHHTMGGLKINTKAEVLDKAGKPIPGLFAAGEVTGGIHGNNRLGGNAVADIITFGRIAGQSASAVK